MTAMLPLCSQPVRSPTSIGAGLRPLNLMPLDASVCGAAGVVLAVCASTVAWLTPASSWRVRGFGAVASVVRTRTLRVTPSAELTTRTKGSQRARSPPPEVSGFAGSASAVPSERLGQGFVRIEVSLCHGQRGRLS